MAWDSLLLNFGEEVKILPKEGNSFTMKCIYRESSEEFSPNFSRQKILRSSVAHLKYMPKDHFIEVGDRVEIRGKLYRTQEKIPDGYGGFVFELQSLGKR